MNDPEPRQGVRTFKDRGGRMWEVSVGRESWGTQLLLFTSAGGGHAPRKLPLASSTSLEAMQELERLADEDLCDLLERSEPWQ